LTNLHEPVKVSILHLPIAVPYQSQLKSDPVQNSGKLQLSILKKSHPFPFPHVVGSAAKV
jgi:hypothetical protein